MDKGVSYIPGEGEDPAGLEEGVIRQSAHMQKRDRYLVKRHGLFLISVYFLPGSGDGRHVYTATCAASPSTSRLSGRGFLYLSDLLSMQSSCRRVVWVRSMTNGGEQTD